MRGIIKKPCTCSVLFLGLMCASLLAEVPTVAPDITKVTPRGAQQGTTVTVTVEGRNLANAQTILFSESGIKGKIISVRRLPKREKKIREGEVVFGAIVYEAPPYEAKIEVEIAPNVPMGFYPFRILTPLGITKRAEFAVGVLPEVKEVTVADMPGKAQWAQLPVTLVGTLETTGEADEYQFQARAGQELVFQVIAGKIGSTLEPVLSLLDFRGQELASAGPAAKHDTVLGYSFSTDGNYTIRISDFQRRGGPNFYYRVNAGELPYVTRVFPLGVPKGRSSEVQAEGFNLGDLKTILVKPPVSAGVWDTFPVRVSTPKGESLNEVHLAVGEYQEVLEKERGDDLAIALKVKPSVVINGHIYNGGGKGAPDGDLFQFRARKGQPLIIEVQAHRLGSPLDSIIEVLDAEGELLPRATLRAVLETFMNNLAPDSVVKEIRVDSIKGLAMGDYLLFDDEVMQVVRLPEQPDEGLHMKSFGGRRLAAFGTTATAHALNGRVYKVEVHPPGSEFPPNGLPVVELYWRNDDEGPVLGKDSRLTFIPPQDGTYYVRLRDVRGFQGKDYAYRLTLREPRPDFMLMSARLGRFAADDPANSPDPQGPNVPRGGTIPIDIVVQRLDGFDGPIQVEIQDLPDGLSASSFVIPQGQDSTVLAVSALPDASLPDPGVVPLRIVGRAQIGGSQVVRIVDPKDALIALMPPPDITFSLQPEEITLMPGQETSVSITLRRFRGFRERVPFDIKNLPTGVVVVNSGLSGVNIAEGETVGKFWLRAEPSAQPVEQPIWAVARVESNQPTDLAGHPLRLKVQRKMVASERVTGKRHE